jgi:hypothetical protein
VLSCEFLKKSFGAGFGLAFVDGALVLNLFYVAIFCVGSMIWMKASILLGIRYFKVVDLR